MRFESPQTTVRAARPKRVLIVEEALRSLSAGHWYEYIRAITEGCRAVGAEVDLLVHKDAEPEIIKTLRAQACLRYSAWDRIYDSPMALKRYLGVLKHNARLAADIKSFLKHADRYDIVLAPTILAHHVLAWFWVLRSFGGRKFDRLAMIFVNTPGQRLSDETFRFPPNTRFMRTFLRKMRSFQSKKRLTLAAETARAAQHLKVFCGLDFELYPHVVSLSQVSLGSALTNGDEMTIGSFGFPRAEKGTELLQRAVVRLLNDPSETRIRFVVQWGKDFPSGRGGMVTKAQELLNDPRVHFIDHALNTDQYRAKLNQLDGLVLPYQRKSYYDRVSRVAIEAACIGLPFIYPRSSWLEDLATRFGEGIGFEDGNLDDLVRAMREFCSRGPDLKIRAIEKSRLARRYHSPERFRRCLFDEPDDLSSTAF